MPLPKRGGSSLPPLEDTQEAKALPSLNEVVDDSDFSPVKQPQQTAPIEEDIVDITDDDVNYQEPEKPVKKETRKKSDERFYKKPKQDKYIDKENKKIIPIGGSKSEIKNIDARKNIITGLKIFRVFVYIIILGLFALGIKNTFFNQVITEDEIAQISQQANGITNFPTERGKAFTQEFMKYYLNFNSDDSVNAQILSKFYEGDSTAGGSQQSETVSVTTGNLQKTLTDPIVYDYFSPFDYLAVYKVTALVTDENGSTVDTEAKLTAKWVSFSVNVYYDEATNTLSIQKDSPTIIPSYEISSTTKIPREGEIGTGEVDDGVKKEILPTITGFLKAYAKSSVQSHDDVLQYISKEVDVSLISGFGGSVVLAGEDSDSVKVIVYKSSEANEWKVDTTVQWQDNKSIDESKAPIYKARYVITVKSTSDGKYIITRINPYVYTMGTE